MTKKLLTTLALGLTATLPCLYADTLVAPGMSGVPATPTTLTGATQLATTGVETVNFGNTSNPLSATVTQTVYRDGSNLACPAGGCLDFVFQFTDTTKGANNTFPGIIERLSSASFSGFLTNFGYVVGTGAAPDSFGRSNNPGDAISFFFNINNVQPGQTTDLLVVKTDATSYNTNGSIGLQDGTAGNANGLSFAPASSSTPEPVSMGLLGSGLAVLGLARLRRSSKKA